MLVIRICCQSASEILFSYIFDLLNNAMETSGARDTARKVANAVSPCENITGIIVILLTKTEILIHISARTLALPLRSRFACLAFQPLPLSFGRMFLPRERERDHRCDMIRFDGSVFRSEKRRRIVSGQSHVSLQWGNRYRGSVMYGQRRERQYQLTAQKHNQDLLKLHYHQQNVRYYVRESEIAKRYDSWCTKEDNKYHEQTRKDEHLQARRDKLRDLLRKEQETYRKELEALHVAQVWGASLSIVRPSV